MATLVDTNVLLRSVQTSDPLHDVVLHALETVLSHEEPLFLAIQNVAEFWNAATRPRSSNGLEWTTEQAWAEIERIEEFFRIVSENSRSYSIWKTWVRQERVSGAQVHDARLAAVMMARGIDRILTFNVRDFKRFAQVEAVHPETVGRTAQSQ